MTFLNFRVRDLRTIKTCHNGHYILILLIISEKMVFYTIIIINNRFYNHAKSIVTMNFFSFRIQLVLPRDPEMEPATQGFHTYHNILNLDNKKYEVHLK
jgi:hypothetical protein